VREAEKPPKLALLILSEL